MGDEGWAPLPDERKPPSTNPFVILWESLKCFYDELYPLMLGGTIAFVASLLIVPGPFAIAGLWYLARQARDGRETTLRVFWEGAKSYGWRNWLNVLVGAGGFALLLLNIWFYNNPQVSPIPPVYARWLTLAWLILLYLWSGLCFFLLPFQLEMERPAFWDSLKKALFLVLLFPFHWLLWLIVEAGLLYLSLRMPPLLIVALPFTAVLSMLAVKALIEEVRRRQAAREAAEDG